MKKRVLSLTLSLLLTIVVLHLSKPVSATRNDSTIRALSSRESPAPDSIPISNRAELASISAGLRGKYHLVADIDLSDEEWIPIGRNSLFKFEGVFDGQGYIINGLTITQSHQHSPYNLWYAGLFYRVDDNAIIKNVGLENVNISIDPPFDYQHMGSYSVGGISGVGGSISNSYVTGYITVTSNIDQSLSVGGISGSSAIIQNCYNKSSVHASSTQWVYAGGLIGNNANARYSISNSYNSGGVTVISSHGQAQSIVLVGGIAGQSDNSNTAVVNSYWNIDSPQMVNNTVLSNNEKKGLGSGFGANALTNIQMQEQASFASWDFDNIWTIIPGENNNYPVLRVFHENNIQPVQYYITTSVSPINSGIIIGAGDYFSGANVTLISTPNIGFTFDGWYENGIRVSTTADYSFTASADRTLEARFISNDNQDDQTVIEPTFDNPHSDWAREELNRAFNEDIVPPLLLDPSVDLREPITRVEFAGIVVLTYENLTGTRVIPPTSGNPFIDTSDIYARMAYDVGLMVGTSSNEFAPDMILNRETAATALTRVFKRWHFPDWTFGTDNNFTLDYVRPSAFLDDASISEWAWDSVYFMAANRIIRGFDDNTFRPRNITSAHEASEYATATREQALLIALRMIENIG